MTDSSAEQGAALGQAGNGFPSAEMPEVSSSTNHADIFCG